MADDHAAADDRRQLRGRSGSRRCPGSRSPRRSRCVNCRRAARRRTRCSRGRRRARRRSGPRSGASNTSSPIVGATPSSSNRPSPSATRERRLAALARGGQSLAVVVGREQPGLRQALGEHACCGGRCRRRGAGAAWPLRRTAAALRSIFGARACAASQRSSAVTSLISPSRSAASASRSSPPSSASRRARQPHELHQSSDARRASARGRADLRGTGGAPRSRQCASHSTARGSAPRRSRPRRSRRSPASRGARPRPSARSGRGSRGDRCARRGAPRSGRDHPRRRSEPPAPVRTTAATAASRAASSSASEERVAQLRIDRVALLRSIEGQREHGRLDGLRATANAVHLTSRWRDYTLANVSQVSYV